MKTVFKRLAIAGAFIAFLLQGCTKTDLLNNAEDVLPAINSTSDGLHVYGLLPMTPEQFMGLPVYSRESLPARLQLKSLPLSATLWNPPVRDQGQIGSCTAFCGTETDEILYYYKNGSTPNLSPAFVYYCERVLILKQKINSDRGAYMVNVPQALKTYGDCFETSYPYPRSNKSPDYKTPPSGEDMTEALAYQIGSSDPNKVSITYGVITQGDVETAKSFLAVQIPVMLGFDVYDNSSYTLFERLNTTNYVYNPLKSDGTLAQGARYLGGHAVPIIGYDDNFVVTPTQKGAFLCQNSWGTSWGNKGFFYMPYSVFKSKTIVSQGDVFGIIPE